MAVAKRNGKSKENPKGTVPEVNAAGVTPDFTDNSPPPGGLTREMLEQDLTTMGTPSITRELLHTGDNPETLWMRTIIVNNKAANKAEMKLDAALAYFDLCDEFGDEDGKAYIRRKLAGWASINGTAREQAVSAAIGERYRMAASRNGEGKQAGPPKTL
ncbi:hypothetical protein ABFB09_09180 [Dehalogenimonas sp. THU2]|uniref:hypothetical protein n=1 Tax=Dehalogenimonas sp. THU2 TaxID=3151121 RepID=UPI0032186F87